jgi:prepilin-type N-terminal cleavage/methylation domain-containing protein
MVPQPHAYHQTSTFLKPLLIPNQEPEAIHTPGFLREDMPSAPLLKIQPLPWSPPIVDPVPPPAIILSEALKMISRSSSAYTLIEVLIVMLIIGIFFSVGFANLRSYSRRQKAENAARQIEGDLRLAQELSLSGRKPENPSGFCTADNKDVRGREELEGIEFRLTSQTSYAVRGYCLNTENNPPTPSYSSDIKTQSLLDNITLAINPSSAPIIFRTLGRGTNLLSNTTISICSDVEDVAILISPEGKISQSATPNCP